MKPLRGATEKKAGTDGSRKRWRRRADDFSLLGPISPRDNYRKTLRNQMLIAASFWSWSIIVQR